MPEVRSIVLVPQLLSKDRFAILPDSVNWKVCTTFLRLELLFFSIKTRNCYEIAIGKDDHNVEL